MDLLHPLDDHQLVDMLERVSAPLIAELRRRGHAVVIVGLPARSENSDELAKRPPAER